MKESIIAFLMQFLRVGNLARIVRGSLCGELGNVVSTDHTLGSVCLECACDGHPTEVEVALQDIERVFRIGDTIRIVASSYLSLEGHIIQICEDICHVCQYGTNEEVNM